MFMVRILGLLTGLAIGLLASAAMAQDSPQVQGAVESWLDQVESLRGETQGLLELWQTAAAEPDTETDSFDQAAAAFVVETEATSAELRVIQPGNDAACILRGIALDITDRLEALRGAADPAAHGVALDGIDRLLFEALLIFGRAEEAQLSPDLVIRVAYAQSKGLMGYKTPMFAPQDVPCDAEATPAK